MNTTHTLARSSWLRRLANWFAGEPATTPTRKTRLTLDTLDAREMPAVVVAPVIANPVADAGPVRVAAEDDTTRIDVSQPRAKTGLMAATAGVTRIAPTALDRRIMAGLQNRKWVHQAEVTNPYTGVPMRITTEIVLVGNGNFSMVQAGESPGYFAPVVYKMGSSGRWWVQNNGVLVLQNIQKSHSTLPNYDFMRIQSWGNGRFVSPDSGTWFQIPQNRTYIPGP